MCVFLNNTFCIIIWVAWWTSEKRWVSYRKGGRSSVGVSMVFVNDIIIIMTIGGHTGSSETVFWAMSYRLVKTCSNIFTMVCNFRFELRPSILIFLLKQIVLKSNCFSNKTPPPPPPFSPYGNVWIRLWWLFGLSNIFFPYIYMMCIVTYNTNYNKQKRFRNELNCFPNYVSLNS